MTLDMKVTLTLVAATLASTAVAQTSPPNIPPEVIARMQRDEAAARAMPDTPGTGRYPAVKEEVASLPDHTIYRPAVVARLGRAKLPVIAWGNGGCAADGAAQRGHLLELASHGYLVIANGGIKSGPGRAKTTPPTRQPPAPPAPGPGGRFMPPPPQTSAAQLTQAIDWAVAENRRAGGALRGRIDTRAIGVSGWSCGGVQALTIATGDPRVRTAVIHNSGLFPEGQPMMPGMELTKTALARLRAPILYVLGGPSDIAHANGMDDYRRITGVPVAVANLPVGHIGTFTRPNGGKAAEIAVHWFDWQLKGDRTAASWFRGSDCILCRSSEWTYQFKGL